MPVEFRCPHCQKLLRVPDNSRGKRGRCPHCKEINDIPHESQPSAASPSTPKPRPAPLVPAPAPLAPEDPFADLPPAPSSLGPLDMLGGLADSSGLTPIPGPFADASGLTPVGPYATPEASNLGPVGYGGGFNPAYSAPTVGYGSYSASGYSAGGYSTDQFDESQPLSEKGRDGIAWENRRLGNSLFGTVKQVLLQPAYAFGSMNRTGGLGRPLAFAIYCSLIAGLINVLIKLAFDILSALFQLALGMVPMEFAGFFLGAMAIGIVLTLVLGLIFVAIFGTLAAIIGAFIHAAILHLVLMLLKGARGTFEATFRLTCYVQGSLALLQVVPLVGWLAAPVFYYVATIIGVRWTHEISAGKSVAAVLITSGVCFVLVIVPIIAFIVLIFFVIAAMMAYAMQQGMR